MTLLVRRFLIDYARTPANLLMLAVIPVVFVIVAADSMSDAARLLGGASSGSGIATVTAGWAAGFLAAVAMYFQVSSARDTDRRLVLAGLPRSQLVAARLVTGASLAVLGSAAALTALLLRTGIDQPARVATGTLMFAAIYLAVGAIVGATVPDPVNGTLVLLFIWIIDVFFGPALSASQYQPRGAIEACAHHPSPSEKPARGRPADGVAWVAAHPRVVDPARSRPRGVHLARRRGHPPRQHGGSPGRGRRALHRPRRPRTHPRRHHGTHRCGVSGRPDRGVHEL